MGFELEVETSRATGCRRNPLFCESDLPLGNDQLARLKMSRAEFECCWVIGQQMMKGKNRRKVWPIARQHQDGKWSVMIVRYAK